MTNLHDITHRLDIFADALHDNDLPGFHMLREASAIIRALRLHAAELEMVIQAMADEDSRSD